MTKTLTEQWKDGELPEGEYFAITTWSDEIRPLSFYGDCFLDTEVPLDNSVIVEVLAPVPDYQTWKDFQQHFVDKLELEVKLKKAYEQLEQESIKVVGLQEQLKEANDTILGMIGAGSYKADEMGNLYLKKWGVK